MSDCAAVLDASAVLALLHQEPGQEVVAPVVGRAAWSAVNLCEVAGKLTDRGMPGPEVREALDALNLTIHEFDAQMGLAASELRRIVPRSLSVGDRACLALALHLGLPAMSAEQEWAKLSIPGLTVKVIR